MKAFQVNPQAGDHSLKLVEQPDPHPADNDIIMKVKAASLNFRDLLVMDNIYGATATHLIPLSDAAGTVVEVGSAVQGFRIGDRVSPNFYPDWTSGPIDATKKRRALGGNMDGVLCEYVKLPESAFVKIPDHLSYEEAACLPCAGLTAWNSLFETDLFRPGQTVLLQGTGGVSIFALLFAKMAGAKVIHLTSTAEKAQHLKNLGADHVINYHDNPQWDREVRTLTLGAGANVVIDVGGPETLERSFRAVSIGGLVVTVGFVGTGKSINPRLLISNAIRLIGGSVGSVSMFERMNNALCPGLLKTIIDSVFPFEFSDMAFNKLHERSHIGKIVISI